MISLLLALRRMMSKFQRKIEHYNRIYKKHLMLPSSNISRDSYSMKKGRKTIPISHQT